MAYISRNSQVQGRQLKVQRLTIPFKITHSATPSAVVLQTDEPSILFLQSEGVNQITAAKATGETATYDTTPTDTSGTLNLFVKIQPEDSCTKVMQARIVSRTTGVSQPCFLGNLTTNGISSAGNIMLTLDSTVNHATTDFDGCLEVEYSVAE